LTVIARKKRKKDADPRLGLRPKPWFTSSFYYFKLERKKLETTRPYQGSINVISKALRWLCISGIGKGAT